MGQQIIEQQETELFSVRTLFLENETTVLPYFELPPFDIYKSWF